VQWAAKQGYTDPARVCIAGGGSGGHAALKSLLHQPQVFKCGISWSALVTPRSDPDSERLQQLRQPVLLAYDKDGERLDYQQGRKLYEALQAQQAPVQWLDYTTTVEDWKTQRPRIDVAPDRSLPRHAHRRSRSLGATVIAHYGAKKDHQLSGGLGVLGPRAGPV
jgi:acetyl esterase/lipase